MQFPSILSRPLTLMLYASAALVCCTQVVLAAPRVCKMNHKTIEYGTRACFNNNCSDVHQRVVFLGNKELVYYDATDPVGITYYDGKTIDITTDELQEVVHSTAPPGTTETATATSKRKKLDFEFTQHRQLKDGTGQVISNYWQEVGVRILGCNTCELILYRVRGNYGDNSIFSTFEPGWCRFVN